MQSAMWEFTTFWDNGGGRGLYEVDQCGMKRQLAIRITVWAPKSFAHVIFIYSAGDVDV
jgi:hypothetical protein